MSFPLWLCPGSLALSSSGGPQPPQGMGCARTDSLIYGIWCKCWLKTEHVMVFEPLSCCSSLWEVLKMFLFWITCSPSCGCHCDFYAHQRLIQSKQPQVWMWHTWVQILCQETTWIELFWGGLKRNFKPHSLEHSWHVLVAGYCFIFPGCD